MSGWRQARAIALLPGSVTIVVPAVILVLTSGPEPGWGLGGALAALLVAIGIALIVVGFSLWLWTVRLFSRIGEGTLAAWDPTRRLVVEGPYSHVRNPMITAVAVVLVGEAILLGSLWLLAWAGAFLAVNFIYFLRSRSRAWNAALASSTAPTNPPCRVGSRGAIPGDRTERRSRRVESVVAATIDTRLDSSRLPPADSRAN